MQKTLSSLVDKMPFGSGSNATAPALPSDSTLKELHEKYSAAKQEHVFKFYEELDMSERSALLEQLSTIDPARINEITKQALNPPKSSAKDDDVEPLPESAYMALASTDAKTADKWYQTGLSLIGEGKVAVVLMAGGQGTRLGSSAPKGCFDIGLPSKKSLFQLQAERIIKIQKLAKHAIKGETATVPWYVMTSGPTRKPTEEFFKEHNYFGLDRKQVIIFEQGVLPCISNEGKILLETKSKVAVSPDGNGGIYQALILSGALSDMQKRGIAHVHVHAVDNCLVRVADPTFIGFAATKRASIAAKVVPKRSATESVGLIVSKNGKPDVVEYSEISKELSEAKDPKDNNKLKLRAANTVNHYYSIAFLADSQYWAHKLPHHVARKKIPCVDIESGESLKPSKPNGIKLEQFVFDVFPLVAMDKFGCLEVAREDDFSVLKNASGTGEDDPETSKHDIMAQGARWLRSAGAMVTSEEADAGVEVSPLVSYGGEGLGFVKGRTIKAPAVIDKEG
jgi:UDP-N-acetylglucosamine/UDP-N-acetylgalactosamine diphosphorylase